MIVLMDGDIRVQYGYFFLTSDDDPPGLLESRGGQANGLCGAAIPGTLWFTTGLHLGGVPVRIEWHDVAPPVGDEWADVVEVSFVPASTDLALRSFDDGHSVQLPGLDVLRARYCAVNMDEAKAADLRWDGDPAIDRYLVQLWPQVPGADAILRETSAQAGYWHGVARDTPPPDPAERQRRARVEAERVRAEQDRLRRERLEFVQWGGPAPSAPLQAAGPGGSMLVRDDRELAELLSGADSATRHAVMVWCVRRVCALADTCGDPTVDWTPTIEALEAGRAVPPPYDDPHALYAELPRDSVQATTLVRVVDRERRPAIHPPAAAMATISAAQDANPLEAACGAVVQAASAFDDRAAFRQELRETFGLT